MKTAEVAAHFGGKRKLAEALGITASAVTMWGEFVPEGRRYQIEVLSKGKFTACSKSAEGGKPSERRNLKSQSVTPRRGRRAGDLTAVQFTQRLANAKAGEFPPEFKATDEYLDD